VAGARRIAWNETVAFVVRLRGIHGLEARLHYPLIIMENGGSGKKIAPAIPPQEKRGPEKSGPPRIN
jgi:hypothetical protein